MISRRTFVEKSAVGASAFMIVKPEMVHAVGKEKLKLGVVGCGGRAAVNAPNMLADNPNVELTALADVFEDKLEGWLRQAKTEKNWEKVRDRVKVDAEHRFTGFDAYKKILATDIDIVILNTPPGYRPEHFEAAVNAKKHIFCEKPVATDAVGVRRFIAAAKKSEELKLGVSSGAWRRTQPLYELTREKFRSGAIGDPVAAYAYWLGVPVFPVKARDPKWSDFEWQHRCWYSFNWLCGDQLVEQEFHNIDCINWFLGMHPVKAFGSGGCAWRGKDEIYGNIYDHMSVEFSYANGLKLSSHCRQYAPECFQIATKGVQEIIACSKGRTICNDLAPKDSPRKVQAYTRLVDYILGKGPYINQAMDLAETTMTCIMGREAAYSGLELTWDMMMNSMQDLQPKKFDLNMKFEVPSVPVPGKYKFI